ncbi:hypothetical protein [Bacillus sp. FJAT-45350]|uniref:hypothetical protein n=1 Tax=Bacillus sp. FJAT-45350 TaxID=2011014 RepID=UPI000BB94FB2|nr:hypothetical protein [Bacillus sp. FJAT-45350]
MSKNNVSHYKAIDDNLSVKFIKPIYIPLEDEKRDEVGQKVYKDSSYANLLMSLAVDQGLVSKKCLTAVTKLDIQDPDVTCIKQFKFLEDYGLGANFEELNRLMDDHEINSNSHINDLSVNLGLSLYAVEFKDLSHKEMLTHNESDVIFRIAQKYGEPGVYVSYALDELINGVVLIPSQKTISKEAFHYFYLLCSHL